MINDYIVEELIKTIKISPSFNREEEWKKVLGISIDSSDSFIFTRAITGAVGQFNFWERDGEIVWSNFRSADWFKIIRKDGITYEGLHTCKSLNLPDLRWKLYEDTCSFLQNNEICLKDPYWWDALSSVYGGDPLRKRETLLWIMLTDMGYKDLPIQRVGCIDYNIILYLRFIGAITGYEGNIFNLYEETKLRNECLEIVRRILEARKDATIQTLDAYLYSSGKELRKLHRTLWDPAFCYRFGCYFY